MNGKGHSDEVSDGNEKHVVAQWRKGNPCYKVAKKLVELCSYSSILWKVELGKDEIVYLARFLCKVLEWLDSSFL